MHVEELDLRVMLSADGIGLADSITPEPGLVVTAGKSTSGQSLEVDVTSYEESRILVRFREEVKTMEVDQLVAGTEIAASISLVPGLHVVELTGGISVQAALDLYRAETDVLYAEADFRVQFSAVPSDPKFSSLWGMHNTGQTGGAVDADIDAVEAWDVTTGSGTNVLAVIDTGIDYRHEDLAFQIWTNSHEIPGNGRDDDNNGFIDDVHGYDFVNNDGDPMDDQSHGTHVAGTIGAMASNGIGVAGVNHHAKLMALKFLNASGSGSISNALRSLDYAVANGASISNNSWGGGGYSQSFYDGLTRARAAGHIFVAAAGNSRNDNDANPFYPATYDLDNVVAVAATDHSDQLASFSSYGRNTVDLGAPGVDVLSTTPNNRYSKFSGTSMATPHVAGVISLLRDQHPEWTYRQVIDQILTSGDPIPALAGRTVSGNRLNAFSAVRSSPSLPTLSILDASIVEGTSGRQRVEWTAKLSAPSNEFVWFDFATRDGTAKWPGDYWGHTGSLVIIPGETETKLWVEVNGDTDVELDEFFHVDISNPRGASIGDGTADITIRNDDTGPGRSVSIGQNDGSPGDTVSVPIQIDNATGVQSVDLMLTYDTSLLDVRPEDVHLGNLTSGWQLTSNVSDSTGTIRVSAFGTAPLPGGLGSLIEIDFAISVSAPVDSTTPLRLPEIGLNEGQIPSAPKDGSLRIIAAAFQVTEFVTENSGFAARFNRILDLSQINLNEGQTRKGASDVVVIGAATGHVPGSVTWDAATRTLRFVKTGELLPTDSYTITLASRSDGFRDTAGELLDGNRDGRPGGDFTHQFRVNAITAPVVSLPDFTRAPGQIVRVPTSVAGLPLGINDAAGVQSLDFDLHFNPAQLEVSSAGIAPGMPSDWQVTTHLTQPGVFHVTAYGAQPMPTGARDLLLIQAKVPEAAIFGTSQALRIVNLKLNEGRVVAVADYAIHQVAFVGDATGNRGYSGLDASLISRIVVELDSGFDLFPLTDPVVVADVTQNGSLSGQDAALVAAKAAGKPIPEIPDVSGDSVSLPFLTIFNASPVTREPAIFLPSATMRADSTQTLSVDAHEIEGLQSADLAIEFDPRVISLSTADVTRGALISESWTLTTNLDSRSGLLRATLFSAEPLSSGSGELLRLRLTVPLESDVGTTSLHLAKGNLNEDAVAVTTKDGVLTVTRAVENRMRMYRAYNPNADFHFFTTSVTQFFNAVSHGYRDETTGSSGFDVFTEPITDDLGTATPIHRVYNLQRGFHYYTLNLNEKNFLVNIVPPPVSGPDTRTIGWRDEGIEGYMYGAGGSTAPAGTTLVHRLYNNNSGVHLFTQDVNVRNAILATFPGVWVEHSPLGYGVAANVSGEAAARRARATAGSQAEDGGDGEAMWVSNAGARSASDLAGQVAVKGDRHPLPIGEASAQLMMQFTPTPVRLSKNDDGGVLQDLDQRMLDQVWSDLGEGFDVPLEK